MSWGVERSGLVDRWDLPAPLDAIKLMDCDRRDNRDDLRVYRPHDGGDVRKISLSSSCLDCTVKAIRKQKNPGVRAPEVFP